MVNLMFIGMIFEIFVIVIAVILLILIFVKYLTKKHILTLYLFIIFLNLTIAIVFSMLSKVLVLNSTAFSLNYLLTNGPSPPNTIDAWIILRIVDFRISFAFFGIGMYISYMLKVKLFEKGYNKISRILIILYFIITEFFSIFIYNKGIFVIDVIAFLLNFIFVVIIYLPLTYETIKHYRVTTISEYKKGFLSLSVMGICFILILLCFLFDRILILLGDPGFTVFYFSAWIFAILGIISAYLGYINPKSRQ